MSRNCTACAIGTERREFRFDEAVESFALDVDAPPFHRALGTRNNTGRVPQTMDFDSVKDYVSVDYYLPPESEDEGVTLQFRYTKFITDV